MCSTNVPAVSIILPVYNRASFLASAFESIRNQEFNNWELIVVDDGSTDDTHAIVRDFACSVPHAVRYYHQENQGPAAARNLGIDKAKGSYCAFFDSDDTWLPMHLARSVRTLESEPALDWVFAPTKGVDDRDDVQWSNSFYCDGVPRAFLRLRSYAAAEARVIDDPTCLDVALAESFEAGLQTSVLRRKVFDTIRLPNFRIGEDQAFLLLAIGRGFRIGYFDTVSVIYRCHDSNVSASSPSKTPTERAAISATLAQALDHVATETPLNRRQRRILYRRIADIYAWQAGYPLLETRQYKAACSYFRCALRRRPTSAAYWKTYIKLKVLRLWHEFARS